MHARYLISPLPVDGYVNRVYLQADNDIWDQSPPAYHHSPNPPQLRPLPSYHDGTY